MNTRKKPLTSLLRSRRRTLVLALQCALAAGTLNGVAYGQQAEATKISSDEKLQTLPTVTVTVKEIATGPVYGYVAKRSATGTKTDTPILETPQSISVVTQDELHIRGAMTLRDVLGYSPGVQIDQGADLRSEWFSIRGFSGTRNLYRDGLRTPIVTGGFSNGDVDPYALERVEVLRGPASVLYGQAAPGGIVNMVTKRPMAEPLHEVELSYGSFNNKRAAWDVGGPLSTDGQWSYRLTGMVRDSNFQTDFVRNDRTYIAPALTWRPSSDTSLTFLASYQNDSKGSTANYDLPLIGTLKPNPNGQIPISRMNSEPSFDRYKKPQSSLGYLFDHRINETWAFKQNLRYSHIKTDYAGVYSNDFEADLRTISRGAFTMRDAANSLTVDNQMQAKWTQGKFDHTVLFGLDYRKLNAKIKAGDGPAPSIDTFAPVYGVPITTPELYENSRTQASQVGLYLQDQVKFDKRWVFLLGGRMDRTKSDRNESIYDTRDEQSNSKATGRTGVVYLFDNGLAPYASYSTSFDPNIGVNAAGETFKPSTGKQAEVGLRYQPPGSRSMFSSALFDLTQQNVLTADPNNPNFRVMTGEVRSRGVELEGKIEVTPAINLIASYTYLDTKITKSNDGVEGNQLGGVPKHSASTWVDYTVQSGDLRGLTVGTGARFRGETFVANTNIYSTPARTLLDAVLRYNWNQYTFSLNANNLLDKKFVSQCNSDSFGYCTYGLVRNIMASVRYRW